MLKTLAYHTAQFLVFLNSVISCNFRVLSHKPFRKISPQMGYQQGTLVHEVDYISRLLLTLKVSTNASNEYSA